MLKSKTEFISMREKTFILERKNFICREEKILICFQTASTSTSQMKQGFFKMCSSRDEFQLPSKRAFYLNLFSRYGNVQQQKCLKILYKIEITYRKTMLSLTYYGSLNPYSLDNVELFIYYLHIYICIYTYSLAYKVN